MSEKDFDTIDGLLQCLQSIAEWKDLFMTIGLQEYIGMPFRLMKQLALMMYTLVRLVTLEDPAWDTDRVRRTVDLPGLLNHVATTLKEVAGLAVWKDHADNVHNRSSRMMSPLVAWTKSVYDGKPAPPPTMMMSVQNGAPSLVIAAAGVNADCNNTHQSDTTTSSSTASTTATMQQPDPMMTMAQAPQMYAQQPELQPIHFMPELFPYFNQEPWAGDLLGFWDIWDPNKPGHLQNNFVGGDAVM